MHPWIMHACATPTPRVTSLDAIRILHILERLYFVDWYGHSHPLVDLILQHCLKRQARKTSRRTVRSGTVRYCTVAPLFSFPLPNDPGQSAGVDFSVPLPATPRGNNALTLAFHGPLHSAAAPTHTPSPLPILRRKVRPTYFIKKYIISRGCLRSDSAFRQTSCSFARRFVASGAPGASRFAKKRRR